MAGNLQKETSLATSAPAIVEKNGRFAIIEQFLADGMHVMFGNPGTVEQGFLDALANYPQMKYILTLQESVEIPEPNTLLWILKWRGTWWLLLNRSPSGLQ
jgi:hypothetical protein